MAAIGTKPLARRSRPGCPADYQALATMDRPGQIVAAGDFQRMLQTVGEKGDAQKLREAIAPQAVETIDKGVPDIMSDFRATIGNNPSQYQMMAGAVTNLARYYAYRGADATTALQNAYDGIIGKHWGFDGAQRVPKGMLPTI